MRVAVVGANLLGCSTAFYVRQALEGNQSDSDEDEIIIFDLLPRAGGSKFVTLTLADTSAPCGTAASVDISAAPALKSLMKSAAIPLPQTSAQSEWAIFDWDADAYRLCKSRSRLLSSIASSTILLSLLQLFSLSSTIFFASHVHANGIEAFWSPSYGSQQPPAFEYILPAWIFVTMVLSFGFIPMPLLFRFYSFLWCRYRVRMMSSIIYGAPTLASVSHLVEQIRDHLSLVDKFDSASSCITLGHLLSASGMAKFVKQSAIEYFIPLQIRKPFLADCLSSPMSFSYASSLVTPSETSNALACLLSLVSEAPVPDYARASSRYLSASDTKQLCPSLADAASAQIRFGVRVVSAMKTSDSKYDVRGVIDGAESSLGIFDAVLLAAVVDPTEFISDVFDSDCKSVLSLNFGSPPSEYDTANGNTTLYVSLVRGDIKASFFRLSHQHQVADKVYILNSVNCSQVVRVEDGVWLVTSSEQPEPGSSLCDTLFDSVNDVVVLNRPKRLYSCAPLRNVNSSEAPDIILGKQFINVAAIDRVCNDVNMDCFAARNAASFFRHGVASWK